MKSLVSCDRFCSPAGHLTSTLTRHVTCWGMSACQGRGSGELQARAATLPPAHPSRFEVFMACGLLGAALELQSRLSPMGKAVARAELPVHCRALRARRRSGVALLPGAVGRRRSESRGASDSPRTLPGGPPTSLPCAASARASLGRKLGLRCLAWLLSGRPFFVCLPQRGGGAARLPRGMADHEAIMAEGHARAGSRWGV